MLDRVLDTPTIFKSEICTKKLVSEVYEWQFFRVFQSLNLYIHTVTKKRGQPSSKYNSFFPLL